MEQPRVSIAVISYNQQEYIREAVLSCVEQEYQNLEVIVVDDASTDRTVAVLEELATSFPGRLRIIANAQNVGITRNSQLALEACDGEFIALMGGDDIMLPGKIARQVAFMQRHPEAALTYHEAEVFDSESNRRMYSFTGTNIVEGGAEWAVVKSFICAGTAMFRRAHAPAEGFDLSVPVISDWKFWIDLLAQSRMQVLYMPGTYLRYRKHQHNVTAQMATQVTDYHREFHILQRTRTQYPWLSRAVSYKEGEFALLHILHNWRKGRWTLPQVRLTLWHVLFVPSLLRKIIHDYLRGRSRAKSDRISWGLR